MSRTLTAILIALVSGTSAGQMMGGQVAEQLIFCNWSSADLFGVGNQAFMAR